PCNITTADFNGDGNLDLAVTNYGSNNVSILLGQGDGTFGTATNFGVGSNPVGITTADFNGDGKDDLAVANSGSNNVSILLNQGNGTFGTAVDYVVGSNPNGIITADFNCDGKGDLAVANEFSGTVSILQGYGDGTYGMPVNYGVGSNPCNITTADFNGDGNLDLAVTNYGSNNVSILQGQGVGTLGASGNSGVGGAPWGITTADFDGNGKGDLAVANSGSNTVLILQGQGDGTFRAGMNYGVGNYPLGITTADFNGDGKGDLAVANCMSNNVSILLSQGDGKFGAAENYGVGSFPRSITTADFNGDGKDDLAVANSGDGSVSILLGQGNGTLGASVNYGVGGASWSITTADFDGNGKGDLAVANSGSNNVSILLGQGDGTFGMAVNYGVGRCPEGITTADFNGDGKGDLAVANMDSNNISILLGQGDGTFGSAVNYGVGSFPVGITTADFNDDGYYDLAAANSGSNNVSILQNQGDGTFEMAGSYGVGSSPKGITTADSNGDGKDDLAVVNAGSNNVSTLEGQGDGTFGAAVNYGVGSCPWGITTADFNGNGKGDLAMANVDSDNVSILLNTTYIAGVMSFNQVALSVNEDCGEAVLTVERQWGRDGTATVNYYTLDETAVGGQDYISNVGSLTFADGEYSKPLSIPINDDSRGESSETFTVILRRTGGGAALGSINTVDITINDNDGAGLPGTIQFERETSSFDESSEWAAVNVKRVGGDCGSVSVAYYTSAGTATGGTDYTQVSGTLAFADGQTEAVIKVPLINDSLQEEDETFTIILDNPGGGATLGTPGETMVTILDDESRPPAEVTGLTLTPDSGQITASWTDPGSASPDKIHLYIKPDGGEYGQAIEVAKGEETYTFTGLVNGRTYQIKVVTVNGFGIESTGVVREAVPTAPGALPDLVVNAVQVKGNAYPGSKIKVSFTVLNQGQAPSVKSDIKVYVLTSENQHPENCVATKALSALKPTKSKNISLSVTLPSDLTGSKVYLLVAADDSGVVAEPDDWNNWSMITLELQYPDLAFSVAPVITGNLEAGATVTVRDTVVNLGGAPAVKCIVTYYIWDGADPATKVKLGERNVAALKPGKASKGKVKLTLPGTIPAPCHLLAVIDEIDQVKEKDEGNNQAFV
ncbi:MAG: FG-GAP-like repeat-containing protein, partial [Chitinophagales bacterium]